MPSVIENLVELLRWVENEVSQISKELHEGGMSPEDASRFLENVRRKVVAAMPATSAEELHSEPNDSIVIPPQPGAIVRCVVSPEDSETIEAIRRLTYESSVTDDSIHNTETARLFAPFADDEIARSYIAPHLRRCADLVDAGHIDNVPSVASIAESLLILTRELALEPCETESEFRWCSFEDSGTDEEFLQLLGVARGIAE